MFHAVFHLPTSDPKVPHLIVHFVCLCYLLRVTAKRVNGIHSLNRKGMGVESVVH